MYCSDRNISGAEQTILYQKYGKENGTYIRVAGTSRPVDEAILKDLEYQGTGKSYDEIINVETDYDEKQASSLYNDIRMHIAESSELPINRVREITITNLENWGILKKSGQNYLPTNAFILCTSNTFRFAKIQCALFKGEDRAVFIDRREFAGPIYNQIEEAYQFEQYIGRLNRDYEGKEEVIVYDYVDSHIRVFDHMYAKRLRTYKRTGFQLITNSNVAKQTVNSIYDSGNYMDVFERDIIEAEKEIVVSNPELTQDKVERFTYLVKLRQEAGVEVTVITEEPQNKAYGSSEFSQRMIQEMQENGIYVIVKDEVAEHFAVIDDELVWHGGMNLLGREDAWDNLMRIKSVQVATELLEIVLGKEQFLETT